MGEALAAARLLQLPRDELLEIEGALHFGDRARHAPPLEAAGGAPQLPDGLPLQAQAFECVIAGHSTLLRAEAPAFAPSCAGEVAARARESALLAALEVAQVPGERGIDEVKKAVDQVLGKKVFIESPCTQKGETFEEQVLDVTGDDVGVDQVLGVNAFIEPLFTQEGGALEEQSMDVIRNDAGVDQVLGEDAFIEPLFTQKGETSEEQVLDIIRVEVGVDQVLREDALVEPLFAQKGEVFEEQVLDVISNDAGVDQVLGENASIEALFTQKGETALDVISDDVGVDQRLGEYAFIEPLCTQKGETVLGAISDDGGVDQVLGENAFIEPLFTQKGETFEEQRRCATGALETDQPTPKQQRLRGHSGSECGFVSFLDDFSVVAVARAAQGPKSGVESPLDWAEARAFGAHLGSAGCPDAEARPLSPCAWGHGALLAWRQQWQAQQAVLDVQLRRLVLGLASLLLQLRVCSAALGSGVSPAAGKPKADKDGWVDQPRGRKAQLQARSAASRAASAKSQTSASAASGAPSGGGVTAVERLQATVEQPEALQAGPPEGVDGSFTSVVASQLESKRAELAKAQQAAAEQKDLEQKQAARDLAEAQLQKAREELAERGGALEEASRALQVLEARASSNFEVAWAAIRAQMEAVRAQLAGPPLAPTQAPRAESCPVDEISSDDGNDGNLAGSSGPWQPQAAAERGQAERYGNALGEWPQVAQACKRELAAEAANLVPSRVECTRRQVEPCRWSWEVGSHPSAPNEAARQWIQVVECTLVGIHGVDDGDLRRYLGRAEGPIAVLMPLSAAVKHECRHRHSAPAHAMRQALDVALQRLTDGRRRRWQPSRGARDLWQVVLCLDDVEAATTSACEEDEFGPSSSALASGATSLAKLEYLSISRRACGAAGGRCASPTVAVVRPLEQFGWYLESELCKVADPGDELEPMFLGPQALSIKDGHGARQAPNRHERRRLSSNPLLLRPFLENAIGRRLGRPGIELGAREQHVRGAHVSNMHRAMRNCRSRKPADGRLNGKLYLDGSTKAQAATAEVLPLAGAALGIGAPAKRPCLQSSRSTGSSSTTISAAAVAFSILGHTLCYARAGEDAQEVVACSRCGAYKVLGSRAGAKPRLKERCPGDKTSTAGRNQRSLWARGLHPGGRPRADKQRVKGEGIPALRSQGPVPGHAQERYLEWFDMKAESAGGASTAASSAGRGPAAPAAVLAAEVADASVPLQQPASKGAERLGMRGDTEGRLAAASST
ncbi:unnamed protein product, partial [Prorocentrum cordatum]